MNTVFILPNKSCFILRGPVMINQNILFDKYEIIGDYTNEYINGFKSILGINTTVLLTGDTEQEKS
jgi:hypothetical protein